MDLSFGPSLRDSANTVDGAAGDERTLFGGAYAGRRVLVTGHTGFKGSWLALWLRRLGADVCGLALPADGEPNHSRLLGLTFDEALVDLRDAGAVRAALARLRPEVVFHLAAQPLVRRSYREPAATFDVNVGGLVNLLEAVRSTSSVRVVVNATTDKCYLERPTRSGYREDDALGGHDPYSASKACAEIVSASYRSSFLRQDDGRGHPVGARHRARRQRHRRRRLERGSADPRPGPRGHARRVDADPLSAGDAAVAARAGAARGLPAARPASARRPPHPGGSLELRPRRRPGI